ncbi:hypothetical protein ONZ45_g14071 [Pleurotus djamor]|nr:hypothetical protein ONZ45_g14071 [Pleurotus djamor]
MQPEFEWPLQFCVFSTVSTYVLSILTANVSQVDRVWTFLPTIYTAYFALLPLWPSSKLIPLFPFSPPTTDASFSPRALLMLALVTIWMFRLSYNTYRRGLFSLSDEDYRWAVLRKQLHPVLFQLVNISFIGKSTPPISLYTCPTYTRLPTATAALTQPHTPLESSDIAFAALALLVLAIEFTADNQQFAFQSYKSSIRLSENTSIKTISDTLAYNTNSHKVDSAHYSSADHWPGARLAWTKQDADRGFVTRGLWRYSRHPNFACEQTFWWIITLMPLFSTSSDFIASANALPSTAFPDTLSLPALQSSLLTVLQTLSPLLPAVALSILFVSSTIYTESITASKYPKAYRAYQERVGMFGFFKTLEKGFLLGLKDPKRKAELEALVWGQADDRKSQ